MVLGWAGGPVRLYHYTTGARFDGGIAERGLTPSGPRNYAGVSPIELGLPEASARDAFYALTGPIEERWLARGGRLAQSALRFVGTLEARARGEDSDIVFCSFELDPHGARAMVFDRALLERSGWRRTPQRNAHEYWNTRKDLVTYLSGFDGFPLAEVLVEERVRSVRVEDRWPVREFAGRMFRSFE